MATIPANNNTGLYNTSGVPAVTGNDLTVSGNVNANNVNAVNTVNAGTSITAGTNITAGGNVTADYFIGDGSLLTNINAGNIVGSYGNANVAAYLASGSNSSNVVTTGNVSGTYILGDGSQLTGLPATYGNANVNAHMAAFGSNTIVTTGNITGGYLFGNGSQLTGIAGTYGNADVAAFLPTYTGNLAGGNGTITNDLTVGGTIYGTFSGNISGNLVVPGSNTQVLFNNSGNAGASADFTFNDATNLLTVAGNVNATAFNGSGAGLTSLPGANVTGTVANATYATSAGTASTATDAAHATVADSANTVAGANVTGTVALANAATYAGTVTTAAQPNITSVGTLTSLTTSGNVDVGGSLNTDDVTSTGNVTIYGNQVITGNLTVQGTTTTINSNTITTNDKTITVANNQSTGANVNGAGLEAGNPAVATFLYDDATTTWKSSIGLAAVGNITGSYIFGNGSQLTGLPSTYSNADVNAHLAAFGSNVLTTTGNITGGNIIGTNLLLTGNISNPTSGAGGLFVNVADGLSVNASAGTWAANITQADGGGSGLTVKSSNEILNIKNSSDTAILSVVQTGANVTGYLGVSGNITGGNLLGTIGTAAQPNITSLGTLTSLGVAGNITAGGILTDGYYYANGTPVTFGGGSSYGNANVAAFMAAFGSNTISTTGTVTTGVLHAANIGSLGSPVNTGWFQALAASTSIVSNGSLDVGGNAIITGNISAAYFTGNGRGLTGLSTYGNSNVATFLNNLGTNAISTSGNITGGNINGTNGIFNFVESAGNIDATNLNLSGGIYATDSSLTIADINVDGNIIMNGAAGGGTAGANIDYINGGGYARFYGNVSSVSGYIKSGDVAYARTDGTAGQALLTYGNGMTYFGAVASSYGNANVTTLLASFGSNTISTTGNVTGGNLLTSGVVASTGNVTGGNLITAGQVIAGGNISGNYILGNGSALTGIVATSLAGTMSGNINTNGYYIQNPGGSVLMGNLWLQGSQGLATDFISSPTGDFVTIENVLTTKVLASGNIQGANVISNASITAGTTITATGNITSSANIDGVNINSSGTIRSAGDVYITGQLHVDNIGSDPGSYVSMDGVSAGLVYVQNQGNLLLFESSGSGTNYTGFRSPATLASNYLYTLPTSFGSASQFLQTDGTGNLTWATGGGGGGSPGGSDTQIQFNDGGSFAGNAAMTFSKTSGNIGLGNLIVNTQQIQTTANSNVALSSSITPNPGRVVLGSGYNGNISPAYDLNNNLGRSARFLVSDSYSVTDGNSVSRGMGIQNYYTLNANVTSTNARINGMSSTVAIGGGSAANTISGALTSVIGTAGTLVIGGGTSGNLTGLGNTTVQYATGVTGLPQINAGSTGGNLYGLMGFINNFGTANTAIGFGINLAGSGTYGGNAYGVYMAGATNNHGYTTSNNARNANYYFLKNEDNHAFNQVGQLSLYQETMDETLASSGGAVTVDKTNGQVQYYTVSEDATMSFSNFVVSSTVSSTTRYMTDTVTVIVKQDGTGRTITMPSGSAYKYAAGTNTVPSTADSVSMISITAYYDTVAAATAYLITISPEFS